VPEKGRDIDGDRGKFWGLESVACPTLSNYGRTSLDPFKGHVGAPVEPHELGIHDGGGARNLSCAQGSHIPCAGGGIHGSFHDFLRVGIRCAVTPIPPLTTIVLWPGATQFDPLENLAHCSLCDSV
jgi:hypothetical protein